MLIIFYLLWLVEQVPFKILNVSRGSNFMILKNNFFFLETCLGYNLLVRSVFFFNTPVVVFNSLYQHRIGLIIFYYNVRDRNFRMIGPMTIYRNLMILGILLILHRDILLPIRLGLLIVVFDCLLAVFILLSICYDVNSPCLLYAFQFRRNPPRIKFIDKLCKLPDRCIEIQRIYISIKIISDRGY